MKQNIFLALSNKKAAVSIAKMLISDGIKIESVLNNIADLNQVYTYYRNGIIITGYKFSEIPINSFIESVPDNFTIILIGNKEQLDNCSDDRVFKLAVPLHKNDLVCTVEMLATLDSNYRPKKNITNEEQKYIDRAKHILIDTYSMTEEQSYRYIQKKSMDTGRKLVDIAKIILEI